MESVTPCSRFTESDIYISSKAPTPTLLLLVSFSFMFSFIIAINIKKKLLLAMQWDRLHHGAMLATHFWVYRQNMQQRLGKLLPPNTVLSVEQTKLKSADKKC